MDIPIQAAITICTALGSIIGILIVWYLTKLLQEVKELKSEIKTLGDTKMGKDLFQAELKSIDTKLNRIPAIESKIDTLMTKIYDLTVEISRQQRKAKEIA